MGSRGFDVLVVEVLWNMSCVRIEEVDGSTCRSAVDIMGSCAVMDSYLLWMSCERG